VKNFSDYVNLSGNSVESAVNKQVNPLPSSKDKPQEKEAQDAPAVLQGILPKWKSCAANSDCTAVVADCVSWEPINKKYVHKISKNLYSCAPSIDPGFQPVAVCANKVCKATDKTTLVSWKEWLSAQIH
jgi:hypothetical protein